MTTFRQILEGTATALTDEIHTFGELKIGTTEADRMGAQLLLHLFTAYPDATYGQVEDALHAAVWWLTLHAAHLWADGRAKDEPAAAGPQFSVSVASISSQIAAALIKERLANGASIEIPSLGLTLTRKDAEQFTQETGIDPTIHPSRPEGAPQ